MHTLVRARDLVPGTWLDLEGDPYADDASLVGGFWSYEYGVVEDVVLGALAATVELNDGTVVDFPLDHELRSVDPDEPVGALEPDTVAEARGWK